MRCAIQQRQEIPTTTAMSPASQPELASVPIDQTTKRHGQTQRRLDERLQLLTSMRGGEA